MHHAGSRLRDDLLLLTSPPPPPPIGLFAPPTSTDRSSEKNTPETNFSSSLRSLERHTDIDRETEDRQIRRQIEDIEIAPCTRTPRHPDAETYIYSTREVVGVEVEAILVPVARADVCCIPEKSSVLEMER